MARKKNEESAQDKPQKRTEGPKSMHAGRPKATDKKAREEWHARTRTLQITASRATMKFNKTLKELAEADEAFQRCCLLTGMNPTRRQYSRWVNGGGGARRKLASALNHNVISASSNLDEKKRALVEAEKMCAKHTPEVLIKYLENKDPIIDADDTKVKDEILADPKLTKAFLKKYTKKFEDLVKHANESLISAQSDFERTLKDEELYSRFTIGGVA